MPSYHRAAPEFGVNTFTTANQTAPSIARFSNGGFVIVWGSLDPAQDGSESAIKGQRFGASGAKVGAEFRVNTAAPGSQFTAEVATLSDDRFVVAWVSNDTAQDGSGSAIKAQLFAADGTAIGGEFLVNTQTISSQMVPNVAALANGGFVISWDDASGTDMKAQIYDAGGARVGGEFRANTAADYFQEFGDIAGLAGGGFVATWRTTDTAQDGSDQAIKAQIFSAMGAKVGAEFLVNSEKIGYQYEGTVAALADGGFVITWYTSDTAQDGSGGAVKGQVFSASGAKVGAEFLVNSQAFDTQKSPFVTATPDGGFFVVWSTFDAAQDGSGMALKAQAFSASGAKIGGEILINSISAGAQFLPDLTTLADGRIAVTWTSETGDGSGYAVRARILDPNQGPVFPGGTSLAVSLNEGQSAVATVVATDADGPSPLRYSIGGPDAALFAVDPATGALRFIAPPDYESPRDASGANFYSVTVAASDGEISRFQCVQVAVRNVNEGLTFTSPDRVAAVENGLAAGVVTANDLDGDRVAYAIAGGADAALFSIDPSTGALTFVGAQDFEAPADADGDNIYQVSVSATDGSFTETQTLAVAVVNANEGIAPGWAGGTFNVAENDAAAGLVAARDVDGDAVSYSISGGADAARFTIDPATGILSFVSAPDYEVQGSADGSNTYRVTIRAGDGTLFEDRPFEILVSDVNEGVAIKSNGGGETASVAALENGLQVTTVTALDLDRTAPIYWISGGADAGLFELAADGRLSFHAASNFEAPGDGNGDNIYEVVVSAGDGVFSDSQTIFITVGNVDEGVTLTSHGGAASLMLSVAENGVAVSSVSAVDADGGSVTYSIAGGRDAARFTVDAVTGALRFVAAPNFEAPTDSDRDNVYEVAVSASDGSFGVSQAFLVAVQNLNEALDIVSNGGAATAALSVAENSRAVTTVAAADPDGSAPHYSIVGGADAARFTIDAASGALSFVTAPNYEAPADAGGDNVYNVVVSASDGSFTDTQALAVTVTNVMEGNTIIGTSSNNTISTTTSVSGQPLATQFEDVIYGLGGSDNISGAGGADVIDGGAGNDTLNGGLGADVLTGGLGADRFVYTSAADSAPSAADVIRDFSHAQGDHIDLSAIDANPWTKNDQAFRFIGTAAFSHAAGELRYEQAGGNTFVSGDINGDGVADFTIQVDGLVPLTAADFML